MNRKTITLFSILVILMCVAARTVTLIYVTESATGFFISRLSVLGIALSVAVLFLTLLASAFAFAVPAVSKGKIEIGKPCGVLSVIIGLSLILYSFGFGLHESAFLWQTVFEIASGLLSALWFIAVGVNAFYSIKIPVISNIIPCVHWIFRLIVVFGTFSSNALVAEHIFSLASLCVTCVFMLELGKNRAEIVGIKKGRLLYPVAICGAILNLVSALPRLIVTVMGQSDRVHGEANIDLVSIAVGIFMLMVTLDIKSDKKIGE